jgi:hypothetical protein
MRWFIGFLAIGVAALGAGYDRRRQRHRLSVARPEVERWEEEGGSIRGAEPLEIHSSRVRAAQG